MHISAITVSFISITNTIVLDIYTYTYTIVLSDRRFWFTGGAKCRWWIIRFLFVSLCLES